MRLRTMHKRRQRKMKRLAQKNRILSVSLKLPTKSFSLIDIVKKMDADVVKKYLDDSRFLRFMNRPPIETGYLYPSFSSKAPEAPPPTDENTLNFSSPLKIETKIMLRPEALEEIESLCRRLPSFCPHCSYHHPLNFWTIQDFKLCCKDCGYQIKDADLWQENFE